MGASEGLGLAFATYLSGDSLIRSADDEDWGALSPNLSLRIGDRVWAQEGAKVEIRFPLGATAWVNYESELDLTLLERGSRADTVQLALVSGEAAFDVKGFARSGSVFQVDIPNASIRAAHAARFRVNTLPDGTAQIGVISGSLILETPDGFTDVSDGRMAEVQPDGRVLMDFLPDSDEWDDWVASRAAIYDRPAASRRYLPADLSSYAHEFDSSGRWVTDRSYGSVWVPAVERGWSPYSNGRWVWQANDYVWLSLDPWYAPFHFGRWSWGASLGWFWIAPRGTAYWSPGYVGWSVAGDEVSWVPLGHNEVYYGYGNYGSGNVNITNKTVFNVTNVYVNSRVTNGVVAVRRDNFLRGKIVHERIAVSKNPFQTGGSGRVKILAKPPVQEIRPIRETRQARPDVEIKRIALPPVKFEKASRAIRERVVAPTKEKSVFKPGKKPVLLRNVVKEKELEHWVAPKKAKTQKSVVAPPPAERLKKGEIAEKPAPPAEEVRKARVPAGKRKFKRVLEPEGEEQVAPVAMPEPEDGLKGENEKQSSEEGRKKVKDREDIDREVNERGKGRNR
ncbi:MAG: DUF6600 domain-containing protein [Candidatus Geothermincolia bacterium]